jgi:hypothetical protein
MSETVPTWYQNNELTEARARMEERDGYPVGGVVPTEA